MAVRLKDIAAELGVSTVTVSKVLRGHADIGEETRARVLRRMRELNYRPNVFARGLASGRSFAVGLVVPDLVHPFFAEVAKGLSGELRRSGLALILASSEENAAVEREEIRTLLGRGVDALLVASCQVRAQAGAFGSERRTPVLLIDRHLRFPANFVGTDDVRAGEMATEHLISLDRRRIAHIGGRGMSPSVDRLEGYRRALARAGIAPRRGFVQTSERVEEAGDAAGHAAMGKLLRERERPDAVFCYNDLTALGAMQAATEAGLRIPEDMAFVGCGNLRYARYLRVPLTSVDQQPEQMGELAAKLAIELVQTPEEAPRSVLLEPRLVVRASSA